MIWKKFFINKISCCALVRCSSEHEYDITIYEMMFRSNKWYKITCVVMHFISFAYIFRFIFIQTETFFIFNNPFVFKKMNLFFLYWCKRLALLNLELLHLTSWYLLVYCKSWQFNANITYLNYHGLAKGTRNNWCWMHMLQSP